MKHSSYLIKKLFLVIILCVVTLLAFQFQPASLGRLQGLKEGIHGKSIDARTNIYKNGLALIKSTFGLGVGAGGYEESINNNPKMLFTNYIGSAHNLWIEVFANYGGIVWGVFVGWLLVTFWSASKIRKWAEIKNHILIERAMRHTLILMVGLPVGCMLNSSILRWTMLWTAFATIAAMLEMSKRQ